MTCKVHELFHLKKLTAFKITSFPVRYIQKSKSDHKPLEQFLFRQNES